jgi:hypothetical protein
MQITELTAEFAKHEEAEDYLAVGRFLKLNWA